MTLSRTLTVIGRLLLVVVVAAVFAVTGWFAFVAYPGSLTDLFGVLLAVGVVLAGLKLGARLADSLLPAYNVAEVAVEGPITRDGGGGSVPRRPASPGADDIVEQVERADEDDAVDALVVKLNTPGGEIVPSEDIRQAVAAFDGPTVAYTNDMCASGGMWIASGCDELWARDGTIVGSIGVRLTQLRVHELFETHGIDYEGITSGEYKDALSPYKRMEDDERAYLQALSDAWYENFVERVAEGTAMDEDQIRDTEARVYLGEEAVGLGMVDELGDREALEADLEDRLGESVAIREFEPAAGIAERFRGGAQHVAYAFGAGVASAIGETAGGLRLD